LESAIVAQHLTVDLAESEFGGQVYTRRQWEKVKIARGE
jgi:hypothetical protein